MPDKSSRNSSYVPCCIAPECYAHPQVQTPKTVDYASVYSKLQSYSNASGNSDCQVSGNVFSSSASQNSYSTLHSDCPMASHVNAINPCQNPDDRLLIDSGDFPMKTKPGFLSFPWMQKSNSRKSKKRIIVGGKKQQYFFSLLDKSDKSIEYKRSRQAYSRQQTLELEKEFYYNQ